MTSSVSSKASFLYDGHTVEGHCHLPDRRAAGCILKKTSPDVALVLAVCVCVAVLAVIDKGLEEVWQFLTEVLERGGMTQELFAPLVKIVGIALITRTAGELCRDAGQGALSGIVETVGGFAAILVSIPLFRAAWELLEGLL